MDDAYRRWLLAEGYSDNTRATQTSLVTRIEAAYGPLDELIADGGIEAVASELIYSTADERAGRPNPSRLAVAGNIRTGLASFRSALMLYRRFRAEAMPEPAEMPSTPGADADTRQRLALERDMQIALRRDISALDPGLTIIDDGMERAVATGLIDILARDQNGARVVIELKAGRSDPRVIAQTLGYMGDLMDEDPDEPVRGIIVAHEFDARTRSAARALPHLSLHAYRISFAFTREA